MVKLVKVTQSCPTLCNPTDYTVHGILQTRIVVWVAFPFSRGSSQPRDQAQVSRLAGGFFTSWATRESYSSVACIFLVENHFSMKDWRLWLHIFVGHHFTLIFFTFSFFPWTDLGLGCCSWAFSGCWSQGCSLVAVHGFRLPWLLWLQSLVAGEHGLPRGYWWYLLGPRVCRLKELRLMVLVAPQHVESSRTRIEPRSAGRFLSTMPAGESQKQILYIMLQHPVYKILSLWSSPNSCMTSHFKSYKLHWAVSYVRQRLPYPPLNPQLQT